MYAAQWVNFSFGPSSVQLIQVLGCALDGLPVGILHHVGIDFERGSGVGVAPLPLRHLWRSAAFEKQCCVHVSEGVEAGLRNAELL